MFSIFTKFGHRGGVKPVLWGTNHGEFEKEFGSEDVNG
jgi:hypothetical protein